MKPLRYSRFFLFLGSVFLIFSCSNSTSTSEESKNESVSISKNIAKPVSTLEKKLISMDLVDVHSLDTSIAVDMKYSGTDNFMNRDVYGDFEKAYFQKDVADSLVKAQKYLNELKKGYRLIIYDATRPRSVQQYMWDSAGLTYNEKINYLANPVSGSLHNFGCAVDISILDDEGKVLDMGTPFDAMGIESGTDNEDMLFTEGKLTDQQIENRKLLRHVMQRAGFFNVQSEWWHFNACRIDEANRKYKIIE